MIIADFAVLFGLCTQLQDCIFNVPAVVELIDIGSLSQTQGLLARHYGALIA
jgi:membrane protein required for beta-lactamase induction